MLKGFQKTSRLSNGEIYLTLGDGTQVPMLAIKVFKLHFGYRVLILSGCLYVPSIRRNLIFVTHLGE
jgi:hypothetical protein